MQDVTQRGPVMVAGKKESAADSPYWVLFDRSFFGAIGGRKHLVVPGDVGAVVPPEREAIQRWPLTGRAA